MFLSTSIHTPISSTGFGLYPLGLYFWVWVPGAFWGIYGQRKAIFGLHWGTLLRGKTQDPMISFPQEGVITATKQ